jgi:hypothetical protein
MWVIDSEFDPNQRQVWIVSAIHAGNPWRPRQWRDAEAARAWLAGRSVCGYNLIAEISLGLITPDQVRLDLYTWMSSHHPQLIAASLDELMRQNLDLDWNTHGRAPWGGPLPPHRLREASYKSVWVIDLLRIVIQKRGGVRWKGQWWELPAWELE